MWKSIGGGAPTISGPYLYQNYNSSWNYRYLGTHDLCLSAGGNENNANDTWAYVQNYSGSNWRIVVKNGAQYAYCVDW